MSESQTSTNPNVTILEAAELMDKSPQFIRLGLQQKVFDFGYAVKMSSTWTYHISRKQLMEYLGGST